MIKLPQTEDIHPAKLNQGFKMVPLANSARRRVEFAGERRDGRFLFFPPIYMLLVIMDIFTLFRLLFIGFKQLLKLSNLYPGV